MQNTHLLTLFGFYSFPLSSPEVFQRDYFDNNLVERLQGTIRERNKVQRGLKDEYSPFIRGQQLYYNFIKTHESLFGKTPAEIADVNLNLGKNKWEKLLIQSVKNMKRKY